MKIKNAAQMEMLRNAVNSCGGFVSLVDTYTGKEYDLKNQICMAEAEDKLYMDNTGTLELFTSRREDAPIMMKLMIDLNKAA